jgi:serine/threonine protein kinase/WD40 repeat protein
MATNPLARAESLPGGSPLEHVRGLAELAFGSFTQVPDLTQARHLALLPAESLELDLNDPAQRQFGDYELLELLGEGGMGVVYRARQASLDREVAVKLLSAGPWASREFVARFEREAQNAARMQHPTIVTIYEVGSFEGMQFFSMRLVRGESLSARLRRGGKFTPREAAALMRTVAEAVSYAHSLGVLHLDLKPANVLLDETGQPYVADFGLARRLENALAVDNDEVSGTPAYMAPEQAQVRANKLTAATDIWGLGAILYQLLTGQPPFRAETAQETVKLVLEGQVRAPRRWVPSLPLDLQAIVMRCLSRDPAERYPTARALADDLARYVEGRPVQARPLNGMQRVARWTRREPKLAATLVCAIAVLVIGLIATTTQWRRAQHNAATSSHLLWESRLDAALRLQNDGRGFEALAPILANIGEKQTAGQPARVERREVGAILNQGVVLVDRLHMQGAAQASPFAVALSNDGVLYAIAKSDLRVHWYNTSTHAELGYVDLLGLPISTNQPEMPQLLQFVGDRYLLVTMEWLAFKPSPTQQDSYLIDLHQGRVVPFPDGFANLSSAAFSADGRHAMLWNSDGQAQLWQVDPWQPLAPPFTPDESRTFIALDSDGRHFFGAAGDGRSLAYYDAHAMNHGQRIALPDNQGISAWAESPDQKQFAFGNLRGGVFVFDKATGTTRTFPVPPGREVTTVAYSEDGAWLAMGRRDGAVYVFDAATGDPINAGELHAALEVRRVYVDHRQRLLIAAGAGKSALWHLAPPDLTGISAPRVITSPVEPGTAGPYSLAFSAQTGLILTAGTDGEVRFWRAPQSTVLESRAAHLIPGGLQFDGRHVVDVEYNHVRVHAINGGATTPWVALPQPIGFAELVDGGRTLVVASGTQVYVFDAATMRQRRAPMAVANTPMRLVASAAGDTVVVGWSEASRDGFTERLQSFDLRNGHASGAGVRVRGPLRQFELSPDGKRLLAIGPVDGWTQVFDAHTLKSLGAFKHQQGNPVIWASFRPAASSLLLLTRRTDNPRTQSFELLSWDPATAHPRHVRRIGSGWPVAVIGVGKGEFVAGRDFDWLDRGDGKPLRIPAPTSSETTAAVAVSHDGHLIAHAFRYGVQLYDADSGAAVGPLLSADLMSIDVIGQLAFSPDDSLLLARTAEGYWATWRIAADNRPVAELRRDATVLDADPDHPLAVSAPVHIGNDPGAWPPVEQWPEIPAAGHALGKPIPARVAGTDPDLLDLTSVYNVAPDSYFNNIISSFPTMWRMPLGVVRIQGTDYDLRGEAALHVAAGSSDSFETEADGIAVPATPVAAFHLLLFAANSTPPPRGRSEAELVMHYQDGSSATVPLRAGFELPTDFEIRERVPLGWAWGDVLRLMGYVPQEFIADPRVVNPHPERLIASIDFKPVGNPDFLPLLFAITAERVIAAADSRSNVRQAQAGALPLPRSSGEQP